MRDVLDELSDWMVMHSFSERSWVGRARDEVIRLRSALSAAEEWGREFNRTLAAGSIAADEAAVDYEARIFALEERVRGLEAEKELLTAAASGAALCAVSALT